MSLLLAWPLGIVLSSFGCKQQPTKDDGKRDEKRTKLFSRLELDVAIPGRLLFPAYSLAGGPIRFLTLSDENDSSIALRFSNGEAIVWDRSASYATETNKTGGKVRREAVAPKVIVAYSLEVIYSRLIEEKARLLHRRGGEIDWDVLKSLHQIKRDFESFQRLDVLDNVSIGSLYDLIATISVSPKHPRNIKWDEHRGVFVIS